MASGRPITVVDRLADDGQPFFYRIDATPRWALMCLPPKSGSTLWKRALVRGLNAQGFHMFDEPARWHNQPLPYVASTAVNLSSVTQMMLVRHPAARLLSGFLGKIKRRNYTLSGWEPSTGFRGFVRTLATRYRTPEARRALELDTHFQLQSDMCGVHRGLRLTRGSKRVLERLSYRYLHVEDIGHWYRGVACQLGLGKVVSTPSPYWSQSFLGGNLTSALASPANQCFVRTRDCGCELHCEPHGRCGTSPYGSVGDAKFATFNDARSQLEQYYNAETADQLNHWAASDIREFGYLPWRPGYGQSPVPKV